VALGEMKYYGASSANHLQREPRKDDGGPFDSWTGTEDDLDWVNLRQARCERHEKAKKKPICAACDSVIAHCQQLMTDGARYGRQYMVARFQKAYLEYIILCMLD
jgi:hypothetical protein